MADAKHTPGPWSFGPAVPGAKQCFYISGNHAAHNREVDIGTVQGGYYSCEANARLIAAAPDLLEALERVLLDIEFMWEDGTLPDRREDIIYQAARAAIAKAEGAP